MRLRALLTAILGGVAVAVVAAPAEAKLTILDADGAPQATIEKGRCAIKGPKHKKYFHASAESSNGWDLDVYIDAGSWDGFRVDYPLEFGARYPGFDLYGPDNELYSNQFPFPGTPPGAGGAIKFSNNGKKIGVGFYAVPNRQYSRGAAFAGVFKCKYRRR